MTSLLKWARARINRISYSPSPLDFSQAKCEIVPESEPLEEEQLHEFKAGVYYPVNIGDIYESKYQVVGKLGFGSTSTVWLARKLNEHGHVALKVFTSAGGDRQEVETCKTLSTVNPSHPGFKHVRTALDTFVLSRLGSNHNCLVQKPMWDSWRDLLHRNPGGRFTQPLLKAGLKQVFSALDYLHNQCKLVHTDIKADNILQEIVDEGVLEAFTQAELAQPSRRKFVNGAPIYASRTFQLPREFGGVVLSDFGAAVRGDQKRNHDAQPNVYRSPEVMLKVEWSYAIDIWNVGVMIWDLFEGEHLFYGDDMDGKGYSTRAHLAEVIALLGAPHLDLLKRGIRSGEFFTEDGQWKAENPIAQDRSLEQSEMYLEEGKEKEAFLGFMRTMLQWRPEDRGTAQQLVQHPWLNS